MGSNACDVQSQNGNWYIFLLFLNLPKEEWLTF